MKLASCFYNNRVICGIVTEEGLIDIPAATQDQPRNRLHSVKEILIKGPAAMETLNRIADGCADRIPFDQIQWLPPIPRPNKLLALAGNYPQHIQETARGDTLPPLANLPIPIRPFLMPQTAVAGHQKTIQWPLYSDQVDYEIELAVIIGKTAKALSPERAQKVIAGYTIANDISARSVTFSRRPKDQPGKDFYEWLMGKWSDDFLPLGPWMVTADDIPNPQNLKMTLTVNGQVRQNASTSEMIYNVSQIVSFLSHLMTLEPGDVIATGTPHGVGAATGKYLAPGDQIDCTIEGIGTLSSRMGDKPEHYYAGL
jgi:2-keto-4-pentenoate hydratase/2-oxohepta-3-ene-1,7-dioic acid hydratase in catechol pathway